MNPLKIGYVSDLHAEFWKERHFETIGAKVQSKLADADLILLAGDIDKGAESIRTARRLFPSQPVCMVAGNHEFYGSQHGYTLAMMRGVAEGTNVFFLHQESYVASINCRNVRVLGVTLWTDFALFNTPDINMFDAKRALNDFRLIRFDETGRTLTPADTVTWHENDLAWLMEELSQPFDGTTIVMTHHAPVSFAISPQYVADRLSPCFASRLEDRFIRDDIALVVWGHTHHSVDRVIDKTRFISNQTGYVKGVHDVETNDFGTIVEV